MKGKSQVWTLLQSSILTSLRVLRAKRDTLWIVSQIRSEMPVWWRPERLHVHSCLKYLVASGLVEAGQSNLKTADSWRRNGGQDVPIIGYRLTVLGLQEHDRFLSIMADQIARSNAAPGKAAA